MSLALTKVNVVRATGALQQPDYNAPPNYQGSGALLQGPCSSTAFTQVDASTTVFYAGFVGCDRDRPECCPWSVASTGANVQDNTAYDLPKPANNDLAQLASCPGDHYSISGGCCPKYASLTSLDVLFRIANFAQWFLALHQRRGWTHPVLELRQPHCCSYPHSRKGCPNHGQANLGRCQYRLGDALPRR